MTTSATLPRNASSSSVAGGGTERAASAMSYSTKFTGRRGVFEGMPESSVLRGGGGGGGGGGLVGSKKNFVPKDPFLTTEFCAWSSKYFAQPVFKLVQEEDPEGPPRFERHWRFERNAGVRTAAKVSVMKGGQRVGRHIPFREGRGGGVASFHLSLLLRITRYFPLNKGITN